MYFFLLIFFPVDNNDVSDIHKYLMKKKHNTKQCLGYLRKCLLYYYVT